MECLSLHRFWAKVSSLKKEPPRNNHENSTKAVWSGAIPRQSTASMNNIGNLINYMLDGDVDLGSLLFNLTLDVATGLVFGRSVDSRAEINQAADNRATL